MKHVLSRDRNTAKPFTGKNRYPALKKQTRRPTSPASTVSREYGLTFQEYLAIVRRPCDICGKQGERLQVVDHDHETGLIRGGLCKGCNSGLGQLGDFVEGLERAISYLKRSGVQISLLLDS